MGQVMKIHEYATETDARLSGTVRALISGRALDPKEVAVGVDMPKATFYARLNGSTPWKASEVADLASYFGIRIGDLYDGLGGRVGPQPDGPLAQSVELRTFNPLAPNEENAKVLPFRPRQPPQDLSFAINS